jgi:hypothetical protein
LKLSARSFRYIEKQTFCARPSGACVIETYTVSHGHHLTVPVKHENGAGPDLGIVIARLVETGERFIANTRCSYNERGRIISEPVCVVPLCIIYRSRWSVFLIQHSVILTHSWNANGQGPLQQLLTEDGWIGGTGAVSIDETGRNIITLGARNPTHP